MKRTKESTLNLGTVSKEDIEKIKSELPATTWFSHNIELKIKEIDCLICGEEVPRYLYDEHKCFICWRNTNPGALASP